MPIAVWKVYCRLPGFNLCSIFIEQELPMTVRSTTCNVVRIFAYRPKRMPAGDVQGSRTLRAPPSVCLPVLAFIEHFASDVGHSCRGARCGRWTAKPCLRHEPENSVPVDFRNWQSRRRLNLPRMAVLAASPETGIITSKRTSAASAWEILIFIISTPFKHFFSKQYFGLNSIGWYLAIVTLPGSRRLPKLQFLRRVGTFYKGPR